MSNAVFPALAGLKYPVSKTPIWSSSVKTATSGQESRAGFWSFPRYKYSIGYDVLRSDTALHELQDLVGFFNQHYGAVDDWLFNDPDDNSVTAQGFGSGNGSQTAFQLVRSYGGFAEPVRSLNSVPLIYKAGVLQTVTTHYTVSATGLVTFTSAPGSGQALTWTGTYYWRCRFLDDMIDLQKFMHQLWELGRLEFISVK